MSEGTSQPDVVVVTVSPSRMQRLDARIAGNPPPAAPNIVSMFAAASNAAAVAAASAAGAPSAGAGSSAGAAAAMPSMTTSAPASAPAPAPAGVSSPVPDRKSGSSAAARKRPPRSKQTSLFSSSGATASVAASAAAATSGGAVAPAAVAAPAATAATTAPVQGPGGAASSIAPATAVLSDVEDWSDGPSVLEQPAKRIAASPPASAAGTGTVAQPMPVVPSSSAAQPIASSAPAAQPPPPPPLHAQLQHGPSLASLSLSLSSSSFSQIDGAGVPVAPGASSLQPPASVPHGSAAAVATASGASGAGAVVGTASAPAGATAATAPAAASTTAASGRRGYALEFVQEGGAEEAALRARVLELERALAERADRIRALEALAADAQRRATEHEGDALRQRQRMNAAREFMLQELRKLARAERAEQERAVRENTLRIGSIELERVGSEYREKFSNGLLYQELDRQEEFWQQELGRVQDELARVKKSIPKRKPGAAAGKAEEMLPPLPRGMSLDDMLQQEQVLRVQLDVAKAELERISAERARLEQQKILFVREFRRLRDQRNSRYRDFRLLHNDRYMLANLLGRGGFSEVYSGYDLTECRPVALKIHQLVDEWPEEKKANYVRHAMREYEIHKQLIHPRIVRLWDVFVIDKNSFVTVLELCEGCDLDFYLKQHGQLPEAEARSIIMQIFQALRYMAEQPQKIIHYDLKPANVLYHRGEIKITDFGLSKIMAEHDGADIELTSQGAGTYWYLPPETFVTDGGRPRISEKVDVWSAGVILYQMLYGKRPFGDTLTQQKIYMDGAIVKEARSFEFPAKPVVSDAAKDFMRRCLTYHQHERPNVHELCADPYLAAVKPGKGKRSSVSPAPAAAAAAAAAATGLPGV